jgi:type I restriction enzyme S subunit
MSKSFSELAQVNPGVELPSGATASTDVSFVPMSDVSESGELTGRQVRKLGDVRNGFTSFADGDILVAKITPCFENGKGAHVQGLKNGVGFGSTEFHVLRARPESSARYLHHIVQSARFRRMGEVFMTGSAGQKRVPREFFDEFKVPTMPLDEQQKIARVLDTLDTTIRQTEAIIAKLKQVKQGLLHDLLTRGIAANGELRPPQNEAPRLYKASPLGWIPDAWRIERLDDVAERGSGHTPSKNVPSYWNGGIKWVSLADSHRLDQIYINETDKEISDMGIANSSAVKHPAGTVVLSRDAGVGKSAVLAAEMAVSQHFMAWRCSDHLNNLYLYFVLQRMKPLFEAIALGSTVKTIGLSYFKKLQIAVPPRPEQDRAVGILMASEADIRNQETELAKLRLLKSGLMDDLLTGRVRVTPLLKQEATA